MIVAATQTNQPLYCWNFTIQTILLDYSSDYIIGYCEQLNMISINL